MGIAGGTGTHRSAAFGEFHDDVGLDLIVANEASPGISLYHDVLEGRFEDATASSGGPDAHLPLPFATTDTTVPRRFAPTWGRVAE